MFEIKLIKKEGYMSQPVRSSDYTPPLPPLLELVEPAVVQNQGNKAKDFATSSFANTPEIKGVSFKASEVLDFIRNLVNRIIKASKEFFGWEKYVQLEIEDEGIPGKNITFVENESYQDGSTYTGRLKEGKFDGDNGILTKPNNSVWKGKFKEGRLWNGTVIVTENGKSFGATYKNGEIVPESAGPLKNE